MGETGLCFVYHYIHVCVQERLVHSKETIYCRKSNLRTKVIDVPSFTDTIAILTVTEVK